MCIREKEDSEVQTTIISRDYYIIKNYLKRVVNIVQGTIPDFSFNQICGHKGVIKEEKCSVRQNVAAYIFQFIEKTYMMIGVDEEVSEAIKYFAIRYHEVATP